MTISRRVIAAAIMVLWGLGCAAAYQRTINNRLQIFVENDHYFIVKVDLYRSGYRVRSLEPLVRSSQRYEFSWPHDEITIRLESQAGSVWSESIPIFHDERCIQLKVRGDLIHTSYRPRC